MKPTKEKARDSKLFRVVFKLPNMPEAEIKATDVVYGDFPMFIKISGFRFDESRLIINQAAEEAKRRYKDTRTLHLPYSVIQSLEELEVAPAEPIRVV
jgi:hypothetical protein